MQTRRPWFLLGVLTVALLSAAVLIDSPTQAAASGAASITAHPYDFRAERLARAYDRWRNGRLRDAGLPAGACHKEP